MSLREQFRYGGIVDKKPERGHFRRAFGTGTSEWKHKVAEVYKEDIKSESVESDWKSDSGDTRQDGLSSSNKGIIVVALVASAVVLSAVGYFLVGVDTPGPVRQVKSSTKVADHVLDEDDEGLIIGTVEQAEGEGAEYVHDGKNMRELTMGFLESKTHEERLTYIVRPRENGEAMRKFFEDPARESEKEFDIDVIGTLKTNGLQYSQMKVQFKGGSRRLAALVVTQRGRLLDFEAYSRACSIPLTELLEKGGDCEFARVIVKPVSYYNRAFSDDKEYCSFVLSSQDLGDNVIYGYARHDDPTAQALKLLIDEGVSPRMILRLQSIGDSHKSNQFHIEHVYCSGWVKAGWDIERVIAKRNEALER